MSTELIAMLNATGKWWQIGKGRIRKNEPLWGCIIQEPQIGGRAIAMTEGADLADCVVRAIAELETRKVEASS